MTEFTHVIESTGLNEASEAVATCPRVLLDLACLSGEYECLCGQVAESQIATVTNADGATTAVRLTLALIPNVGEPRTVMLALNMTGYRADYEASRNAVTATFNTRRPENAGLLSSPARVARGASWTLLRQYETDSSTITM